jgi:UDP-N-acetylglucosamine--N-acetylmuramyl-(pentapeptide) pyrophosphoryl-undecaprenol N-acetylglucosamine transferase
MKKIVFTGGGTAGHIIPNIAIIEELKNYKIYYLGSSGMEKEILKSYPNITFIEIPVVKLIRKLSLKNFSLPFKLISSINKTKKILQTIKPDLIFSKGGFVSIPPCIAGNQLSIPVITHESDLTIGLANKIIARKAKHLCCSFKTTAENYQKNAIFTGSPIRKKILSGNKDIVIKKHNIKTNKPIILITGGSLGAMAINRTIWNNIDKLSKHYTIIHIVGKNNINKDINVIDYYQIEFAQDIENYFSLADIVISRAGSNTIFELLSIHKPMILVPLPKTSHSRGDQIDNAKYFLENKLAFTIYQEDLSGEIIIQTINHILKNKQSIIRTMQNFKNTCGNSKIIELIQETIK